MSTTAIESRAQIVTRSTAQRVADGVVASYIRALATASPESSDEPPMRQPRLLSCEPGRTNRPGLAGGLNARRQIARRRVLLPA